MTSMLRIMNQGAGEFGRRATSLLDVYRARAASQPERIAFTFLPDGEEQAVDLSYGELDRRARAVAAHLQRICPAGGRVLLPYQPGLDFVQALAGCLYAGLVAVPTAPPDPFRAARTVPRLEAMVHSAEPSFVLASAEDLAWMGAMLGKLIDGERMVAIDSIDLAGYDRWSPPRVDRDTLALLQYTSGSTAEPKGVMLRHGNVLSNLAQMEAAVDVEDAVAGIWLPAYHDMGLIGGLLQCWYSGRRNIMLSPVAFFQRPLRWLEAIERYRITTTGAPDFAYDLCVRKTTPQERRGLDLSCWQLALSGAEPIRAETFERFLAAFAPCGVRPDIFCPSYGLAEATLMVASAPLRTVPVIRRFDAAGLAEGRAEVSEDPSPLSRRLVSCGRVTAGQQVVIVRPTTREVLPAGRTGEVWVAGPNVAAGYWNNPAASKETFEARTATGDGPYLRTGDLGFLFDGELYISGRLKDMMIVHGRNHYPQDIEQSIESCHEALKPYGGAAFSIEADGREQVVVVQEVVRPRRHDLDEVTRQIRRAVLESHDLLLDHVLLIKQGSLPKTTSGKVQRHVCRERFVQGQLAAVHTWRAGPGPSIAQTAEAYVPPRTPTETLLADAWAAVLDVERVGVHDDFFELGGTSLLLTQLLNRLTLQLHVEVPVREFFEQPTVAALAVLVDEQRARQEEAEQEFLVLLESMSDEEAERMLAGGGGGGTSTRSVNGHARSHEASPRTCRSDR